MRDKTIVYIKQDLARLYKLVKVLAKNIGYYQGLTTISVLLQNAQFNHEAVSKGLSPTTMKHEEELIKSILECIEAFHEYQPECHLTKFIYEQYDMIVTANEMMDDQLEYYEECLS